MTAYSDIVWRYFNTPKNVGRIEVPDGEGIAGSPHGGPFMVLTALLAGHMIKELKFETFGCVPAIAAGSFITDAVQGTCLEEARQWTVEKLIASLGGLPEEKHHCAEIAIQALHDLVEKLAAPPAQH